MPAVKAAAGSNSFQISNISFSTSDIDDRIGLVPFIEFEAPSTNTESQDTDKRKNHQCNPSKPST
jgi:hypothetical protein